MTAVSPPKRKLAAHARGSGDVTGARNLRRKYRRDLSFPLVKALGIQVPKMGTGRFSRLKENCEIRGRWHAWACNEFRCWALVSRLRDSKSRPIQKTCVVSGADACDDYEE
jgi:hypothetical protein